MGHSKQPEEVLTRFKEILLAERQKVLEDLEYQTAALNETIASSAGDVSTAAYHMADLGTDMQEREKTSLFAHRQAKYLKEIDAALERIENGTYGICTICHKPIEIERLQAVPIGKYHVACKETVNQRKNNQ